MERRIQDDAGYRIYRVRDVGCGMWDIRYLRIWIWEAYIINGGSLRASGIGDERWSVTNALKSQDAPVSALASTASDEQLLLVEVRF